MNQSIHKYSYLNYQFHTTEELDETMVLIYPGQITWLSGMMIDKVIHKENRDNKNLFLILEDFEGYDRAKTIMPSNINISLLIKDSSECVHAFSVAKRIYCFDVLPDYYVGNKKQEIHYWFSERTDGYKNNRKAKHLYLQKCADEIKKIDILDDFSYNSDEKKDVLLVFFDWSGRVLEERVNKLISFHSGICDIARYYGLKVKYMVPTEAWKKVRSLGYLLDAEMIIPINANFEILLSKAAVIVTDNADLLTLAESNKVPAVFFSQAYTSRKENDYVKIVFDERKLGSDISNFIEYVSKHDKVGFYRRDENYIKTTESDYMHPICNGKSVLLCLDWATVEQFSFCMKNVAKKAKQTGIDLTVMFHNDVADKIDSAHSLDDLQVYYREGYFIGPQDMITFLAKKIDSLSVESNCDNAFFYDIYPGKNEEVYAFLGELTETKSDACVADSVVDECSKLEWKRMLGDRIFDEAILQSSDDVIWQVLNKCVPAKSASILSADEVKNFLVSYLEPDYLKEQVNSNYGFIPVTFDSDTYYYAGKDAATKYMIKAEFDIENYVLCFYDGSEETFCSEKCQEFIKKGYDVVICNTTGSELFDKHSHIVEIQVHSMILSLLINCKAFVSGNEGPETLLADFMNVEICVPHDISYLGSSDERKLSILSDSFWGKMINPIVLV